MIGANVPQKTQDAQLNGHTGTEIASAGGYANRYISVSPHAGEYYLAVLERLHKVLRPKSYLEVGTSTGASLDLARCASIAIDPEFAISTNVFHNKPECHLFQISGDEFFSTQDPKTILKRPIDMSFLDGMHLFEFLLRDFINVEAHSRNNSLIVMHDCIPTDSYVARRNFKDYSLRSQSAFQTWWAGDAWKIVDVLKKYRPDLKIITVDAPPTGLVIVTNLNPTSDVLRSNYFEIVSEVAAMETAGNGFDKYISSLTVESTTRLLADDVISSKFWL